MRGADRILPGAGCSEGDAAAYALGALNPSEAEAFERHLAGCERCAQELAELQPAVDALAMSPLQHPVPSELRRRVMRGVRAEPPQSVAERSSARRRGWPIGLASAAAIGVAVLALAIVMLTSSGSHPVRVIDASVFHSSGQAQVRLADGRAELIVRDFPPPAAGHVYEIWLERAGRPPEPARALFSVSARGAGDIGVPDQLAGVQAIMVTQEPAGGSLVPTGPPVIVGRLS